MHPRLSVNALSSFNWSFDQDLALWRALGVHHAGLLAIKLEPNREANVAKLKEAGIRSSTIVTGGRSAYCPPGRSTGRPWREILDAYAEAIAPCVAYAKKRGLGMDMEPSLRADASFINVLRDAVDTAERTGIGLIVDFGNCWMERDLREVLKRAAPHIALVQICDVIIGSAGKPSPGGRVHLGDGELPLHRLMEEVLNTGYDGLFDLEVLGPMIEQEGYDSAVRRGVDKATAFLEEMGI